MVQATINSVPSILAEYDSPNFLCDNYDRFCERILDDLGCSASSNDNNARTIVGCTDNDVRQYVGACECEAPYELIASATVTSQLVTNRIEPDMRWMLEPWSSGPPYDYALSYQNICSTTLRRLGCSASDMTITTSTTGATNANEWKCECGALTQPTTIVRNLIMDAINDHNSETLPIFENPVYLTRPLSIAMIFICGKIGAIIAAYITLPPIVGYICAGIAIQNFLDRSFLIHGSSELKKISLLVVLMRAALSLRVKDVWRDKAVTSTLSTIPFLCEFSCWMLVGSWFFPGWSFAEMGLFASVAAPLGPSVIINQMLGVVGSKKRDYGCVPKQMLMIAPLEAVLAIVLFGFFQSYNQTEYGENTQMPWVPSEPLWLTTLFLPLNFVLSCLLGITIGYLNSKYIDWRSTHRPGGGGGYEFLWVRLKKNPQMGSHTADFVFVTLVSCYTMTTLCNPLYIRFATGTYKDVGCTPLC
jgi:hypothetical protein